MLLPQPMAHGRLVSRYKRFFADVVLDDGTALTAHCPNPGAMLGLNTPGLGVWLSKSDAPKRKLAWTLELVEDGAALAGVNTMNPNKLVAEALAAGASASAICARRRRAGPSAARARVQLIIAAGRQTASTE